MKKLLIIFTIKFPFGTGGNAEPFLETESRYYRNFDKVIFIPLLNSKIFLARKIEHPNYTILEKGSIIRTFFLLINIIFSSFFLKEFILLLKKKKFIIRSLLHLVLFIFNSSYLMSKFSLNKKIFNGFDKVYIYSYWFHLTAFSGYLLKRDFLHNAILISRAHRFDVYEEANKINYIPLRSYLLEKYDRIFFISEDAKKYFEKKYNDHYFEKYFVSKLGVLNSYKSTNSKSSDIQEINKNSLFVLSCSRMTDIKRIDKILDIVSNYDKKIHWVHIGDGPLYKNIFKKASLIKSINFSFELLGNLTNDKVRAFYLNNKIDFFINLSDSEGIPVSIMEAISFSIPVIATDVGGTSEIVIDNVTGKLLSKNFTSGEIYTFFDKFLLNIDFVYSLKKSCFNFFERNFNADTNYRKFIKEILNK
jgi:glycosyltransferase involved in cell wall biosynthesis